jgi:hypothetical protein
VLIEGFNLSFAIRFGLVGVGTREDIQVSFPERVVDLGSMANGPASFVQANVEGYGIECITQPSWSSDKPHGSNTMQICKGDMLFKVGVEPVPQPVAGYPGKIVFFTDGE